MNILLTGAGGFIGSHLTTALEKEGYRVHALIRSPDAVGKQHVLFTGDTLALSSYLKEEKISGIIHLASYFTASHTPEEIDVLVESNLLLGTKLLEAAKEARVKWFINTGTFWQHYQSAEYSPVNLYAATKQAFETLAQYYRETSEMKFVTLKLNDTFGPHDTRPKVFNLWNKISRSGEVLEMSPGEQLIDISYIDNVCDAYLRLASLLDKGDEDVRSGDTFGVTSGERMTLKELATLFEHVSQKPLHISWGKRPYREREVMVPWETFKTVPGWKPQVSLEEGIRRTLEEMEQNQ